jgi:DNA-binding NarL/FixJ family response regulator/DNA-binding winged helix-turn-helix (wHTH) protein
LCYLSAVCSDPGENLLYLFGDCTLDIDRRELRRGSRLVALEPQVFDLLAHIVQHRDRVVSKDELLATIWHGRIVSESSLFNRINATRAAIGDTGEHQRFIKTLPRKGIRFVGSVREEKAPCAPVTEIKADSMKILLVDDHDLIRVALRGVIKDLMDDASVLEASDCREAMQLIQGHPDLHLVLLDLNLPDRNGFAVLADLRQHYATISAVVLSTSSDRDSVLRALNMGAIGFIPKSAPREVIANALRLVLSGGVYVPPEALAPVETGETRRQPPASPADAGLTKRQLEVLALMMRGKSNKAISRLLDMAEPTVKHHVTAILKALRTANRTEAVIAANELGWDLPQVPE